MSPKESIKNWQSSKADHSETMNATVKAIEPEEQTRKP
jgi:hypothetical protein